MTTIQKLEFILNAYRKASLEVKGTHTEKIDQLIILNMYSGICLFSSIEGFELPEYIIKRNIEQNSRFYYWCKSPSQYYYMKEDPIEGIIQRIIILEKELKHHKRWRFLAKYIKP